MSEECHSEMKLSKNLVSHVLLSKAEPFGICEVIKCEDIGSLKQLFRITALVLKFCHQLLLKIRSAASIPDFWAKAEKLCILESLKSLALEGKFKQWKRQFWPILKSGRYLEMPRKNPNLTRPLICSTSGTPLHSSFLHETCDTTSTWKSIPWSKSHTDWGKVTLMDCQRQSCRKYIVFVLDVLQTWREALFCFIPTTSTSLTYTGVDFAGPIYTKATDADSSKVWICLFLCCVTQGV